MKAVLFKELCGRTRTELPCPPHGVTLPSSPPVLSAACSGCLIHTNGRFVFVPCL